MNELQVAMLTAHAINTLAHQTNDVPPLDRCCWHECAPCHVLHELIHTRELSAVVRPYLVAAGGTYNWWMGSAEHGNIRLTWFMSRMCVDATCQNSDVNKIL